MDINAAWIARTPTAEQEFATREQARAWLQANHAGVGVVQPISAVHEHRARERAAENECADPASADWSVPLAAGRHLVATGPDEPGVDAEVLAGCLALIIVWRAHETPGLRAADGVNTPISGLRLRDGEHDAIATMTAPPGIDAGLAAARAALGDPQQRDTLNRALADLVDAHLASLPQWQRAVATVHLLSPGDGA